MNTTATMTTETTDLIEQAFQAAFNNTVEVSPEFSALCEQSAVSSNELIDAVDIMVAKRLELRAIVQRLSDAGADDVMKRAVLAVWRHSLAQLDLACAALGR